MDARGEEDLCDDTTSARPGMNSSALLAASEAFMPKIITKKSLVFFTSRDASPHLRNVATMLVCYDLGNFIGKL